MIEIPAEWVDKLVAGGFALLLVLVERATKRVEASEPVKRAQKREQDADAAETAVVDAIKRTDAAWQKRWDEREADFKARWVDRESEVTVLVASFNSLMDTNKHNADLHAQALDQLGRELRDAHNRMGTYREEIGEMKLLIAAKEGEVKNLQNTIDTLQRTYDTERRTWHRTMDQERLRREDMTRRAAAAGVPFTATDVMGQGGI